jgi:hypothetical protein
MADKICPELIKCTRNNKRIFNDIIDEHFNVESKNVSDIENKYKKYKKIISGECINKELEEQNSLLFQLYIADFLCRYETYKKKKNNVKNTLLTDFLLEMKTPTKLPKKRVYLRKSNSLKNKKLRTIYSELESPMMKNEKVSVH